MNSNSESSWFNWSPLKLHRIIELNRLNNNDNIDYAINCVNWIASNWIKSVKWRRWRSISGRIGATGPFKRRQRCHVARRTTIWLLNKWLLSNMADNKRLAACYMPPSIQDTPPLFISALVFFQIISIFK